MLDLTTVLDLATDPDSTAEELFFFFNIFLEDNCLTMLCWFLPYNNVN